MSRSTDQSTSLSLLQLACQKDETAWARIVELYTPLIQLWCRRWKLSEFEADDISQHVFHMAFVSLSDFERRQTGSFRSWIYAIARNKLKDGVLQKQKQGELLDYQKYQSQPQDSQENLLLYHRCIELIEQNFSTKDIQIIREYVIKDRTAQEVAQEFGISESAVYVIKHRVVKKVLEQFQDVLDLKQALFIKSQSEP